MSDLVTKNTHSTPDEIYDPQGLLEDLRDQIDVIEEIIIPEVLAPELKFINFFGGPCTGKTRLSRYGHIQHNWVLHDPKNLALHSDNGRVPFALDVFLKTLSDIQVNVFDEAIYIDNLEAILRMTEVLNGKIIAITPKPIETELMARVGINNWLALEFENKNNHPMYQRLKV